MQRVFLFTLVGLLLIVSAASSPTSEGQGEPDVSCCGAESITIPPQLLASVRAYGKLVERDDRKGWLTRLEDFWSEANDWALVLVGTEEEKRKFHIPTGSAMLWQCFVRTGNANRVRDLCQDIVREPNIDKALASFKTWFPQGLVLWISELEADYLLDQDARYDD